MTTKCFPFLAAMAAFSFSMLTLLNIPASPMPAGANAAATDLLPFAGTWTASHDGTRIVELVLRVEKGNLAGVIRVCGFTINTEGSGKIDQVTNEKLSADLPLHNLSVSGKSVSFDWKDPDGDESHWKLELTGAEEGRLIWLGLPSGLKANPIPVNKTSR
jgi:hypothetical protein